MATFSVKNFDRFQHYKDRAPPWIKLYNELLDDYDFGLLPDASKMHLVAIWLLASRSDNKIPYDPEWVARRINATERVNLDALVDAGFIVADQALQNTEHVASKPLAECLPREREETETEKRQNGADAPPDPAVPEREYFLRGREVLGKGAGGLIGNLLKSKGGNVALARAAIEQASQKQNPTEYVAAICRGGKNGNASSGYRADPATGRATAKEAQHVTSVGDAALRYLRQSKPARSDGETSRDFGFAGIAYANN